MVNPDHYEGREQALAKHTLLRKYLPELAYRVGREWEKIVYVDGFAGPWQVASDEYADSSFGTAITEMKKALAGLRSKSGGKLSIQSFLVAENADQLKQLEVYAAKHKGDSFSVEALRGEFAALIPAIAQKIAADKKVAFRFVFLDPKGWAQIPMAQMVDFLNARSCEVLVTLMTRHITRFLDQPDRADSYRKLFGRPDVLERLRAAPNAERAELAFLEYSASLKSLCGFAYVSCAAILRPDREEVVYYLVYGTNHSKGVKVFKKAEMDTNKLQDWVRTEGQARKESQQVMMLDGDGQKTQVVFDLRARFCRRARHEVIAHFRKNAIRKAVLYSDLFCAAMAFPLVTPEDLISWLKPIPGVQFNLAGVGRRVPSPDEVDEVSFSDLDAVISALSA